MGAGCCAGGLEDEVGPGVVFPAPWPGVIGPFTSDASGLGAWGVGASGTVGCCCWATAAVLKLMCEFGLKLRSAASAIAVKTSFTDILQWSVVSFSVADQRRSRSLVTLPLFVVPRQYPVVSENRLRTSLTIDHSIQTQGRNPQSIRRAETAQVSPPAGIRSGMLSSDSEFRLRGPE